MLGAGVKTSATSGGWGGGGGRNLCSIGFQRECVFGRGDLGYGLWGGGGDLVGGCGISVTKRNCLFEEGKVQQKGTAYLKKEKYSIVKTVAACLRCLYSL